MHGGNINGTRLIRMRWSIGALDGGDLVVITVQPEKEVPLKFLQDVIFLPGSNLFELRLILFLVVYKLMGGWISVGSYPAWCCLS